MLEVAAAIRGVLTPYTVRFVAFGAEEQGLRGSRHYVAGLTPDEIGNIAAMINLDSLIAGEIAYVYGDFGEAGVIRDWILALASAEGDPLQYYNTDGSDAIDADGDSYTVEADNSIAMFTHHVEYTASSAEATFTAGNGASLVAPGMLRQLFMLEVEPPATDPMARLKTAPQTEDWDWGKDNIIVKGFPSSINSGAFELRPGLRSQVINAMQEDSDYRRELRHVFWNGGFRGTADFTRLVTLLRQSVVSGCFADAVDETTRVCSSCGHVHDHGRAERRDG